MVAREQHLIENKFNIKPRKQKIPQNKKTAKTKREVVSKVVNILRLCWILRGSFPT